MRDKKLFEAVTSVILIYTLIFSSLPAEAALSSRYEGNASAVKAEGRNIREAVKREAPSTAQTTNRAAAEKGDVLLKGGSVIPQRYAELIKKEHARYCEAFVNAEMGHRYYYKQIYDAKYKGKKTPAQEELEAMRFELKMLMKDLSSSAKRYARNIGMAKMAMAGMDEGERTLFAKLLSSIFARPAYAFDASSLDGIEAGLNNIANSTADVGYTNERDAEIGKAQNAKIGLVVAAGIGVIASGGLMIGGVVGGVAIAGATTTTAGALGAGALTTLGIVGGGLSTVDSTIGFIDAVTDKETDTSDLKHIAVAVNTVTIVGGGAPKSVVEGVKTVVDLTEATKDEWIPKLQDILSNSEDSKAPGRDGVKAVKKAKDSCGGSNSNNGGGGGGG